MEGSTWQKPYVKEGNHAPNLGGGNVNIQFPNVSMRYPSVVSKMLLKENTSTNSGKVLLRLMLSLCGVQWITALRETKPWTM